MNCNYCCTALKQKFNLQAQTNLTDWFRYGITFLFTKASGCGKCRFAKAKKIEKPSTVDTLPCTENINFSAVITIFNEIILNTIHKPFNI
jgi:hypothetical protein